MCSAGSTMPPNGFSRHLESPVASEDSMDSMISDGHAMHGGAAYASRGDEAPLVDRASESARSNTSVANTDTTTPECASAGMDCTRSQCCMADGAQCYQKSE